MNADFHAWVRLRLSVLPVLLLVQMGYGAVVWFRSAGE